MPHRSIVPLLLPLLAVVGLSSAVQLYVTRSDAYFRYSILQLRCSEEGREVFTFWRKLTEDGAEQRVMSNGSSSESSLIFELTPSNEGFYFCRSGNEVSNMKEIVAFPLQDPVVKATPRYSVPIGSDVVLQCVYNEIGALSSRYRIEWYRGLLPLLNLETELPERYKLVSHNFSLIINDTTVEDVSEAYYCALNVENPDGNNFYLLGPVVGLEVYDQLRLTGRPSDAVIRPRENATFDCVVSGSPVVTVKWLLEGLELSRLPDNMERRLLVSTSTEETASMLTTTSTLDAYFLEATESGRVSCVAYHILDGNPAIVSATANLVILPNDFVVELQALQSGSAQIRTTLPSRIPTAFSLVVRYIVTQVSQVFVTVDVILVDESFANTREIVYDISEDKLPHFPSFQVQAAVQIGSSRGQFSRISNLITLSTPPGTTEPTPSNCPPHVTTVVDSKSSTRNSSQRTLLIVFIVVIVLGIIVAVVISALCILQAHLKRQAQVISNIEIVEVSSGHEDKKPSRSPSRSRSSSRSSKGSAVSDSRSPSPLRSISHSRSRSRSGSETPSGHEYSGSEDRSSLGGVSVDSQELAEREKRKHRSSKEKPDQEQFLVRELSSEDVYNLAKRAPTWNYPKRRSKELQEEPDIGYDMPLAATNPRFHT